MTRVGNVSLQLGCQPDLGAALRDALAGWGSKMKEAYLKPVVRPDHIWFADDIFGLQPKWVAEFAREVEVRDDLYPVHDPVSRRSHDGQGGGRTFAGGLQ